jgi:glycosyltransferase involved in cell wall biosynthesis
MAHATGVPASKFKKSFPEVKYLLTLQEGDPPAHIEHKMRMFGESFKRAFTTADSIQVISNFLGNWAKQKGFRKEPILIPNAVNTTHFSQSYSEADLKAIRAELGFSKEDVLLVTTSRLVHKNAVDNVIKALPTLPEKVKFIIFGTGPDEDMLKALAKKIGVEPRVVFYGQIEHADMPKYLKACDIFIRPSRSEGMGNSFVEAMAAELPVVATQAGGIADFLFDEKLNPDQTTTGWAVGIDSPTDITKAVMDITKNPEKVQQITKSAKSMVLNKYDWDLIAKNMEQQVFDPLFK